MIYFCILKNLSVLGVVVFLEGFVICFVMFDFFFFFFFFLSFFFFFFFFFFNFFWYGRGGVVVFLLFFNVNIQLAKSCCVCQKKLKIGELFGEQHLQPRASPESMKIVLLILMYNDHKH